VVLPSPSCGGSEADPGAAFGVRCDRKIDDGFHNRGGRAIQKDRKNRRLKKDARGVHLAVLQTDAEGRRGSQARRGPACYGRTAVSAYPDVVRGRICLFLVSIGIEEDRDRPRNARVRGSSYRVGNTEASRRTHAAQCLWTRILQDKRESVRAMKEEPVLVRQLELERGVKARPNRLFFAIPKSARFFFPGRRNPQDFARDPGIAYQAEPLAGREIVEVDLGMRSSGGDRNEQARDPNGEASAGFHIAAIVHTAEGAATPSKKGQLTPRASAWKVQSTARVAPEPT